LQPGRTDVVCSMNIVYAALPYIGVVIQEHEK